MRALVVYESMYGNTHVVAGNIADGLRATYEVTLVPVAEVTAELVAGTDLLVAGAPTHMHGRYGPAASPIRRSVTSSPGGWRAWSPSGCRRHGSG
jgi:flavodoxin